MLNELQKVLKYCERTNNYCKMSDNDSEVQFYVHDEKLKLYKVVYFNMYCEFEQAYIMNLQQVVNYCKQNYWL